MKCWSLEILQLPYRAAPGKMQLRNRCVLTTKSEGKKEQAHGCPQAEQKADHVPVTSVILTKSKTKTKRNIWILSKKDYVPSVFIFFSEILKLVSIILR